MKTPDAILLAAALLLTACHETPPKLPPPGRAAPVSQNLLPRLPQTNLLGPRPLPALAKLHKTLGRTVTLAWDNDPVPDPGQLQTIVEATRDAVSFSEVARLPYAVKGLVTLTNRPWDYEFYRVGNTWK